MLTRPSRLRQLAETARQRAVQERALLLQSPRPTILNEDRSGHGLGDTPLAEDAELEITWGTFFEEDTLREAVPRNPASRQTEPAAAKWPADES